MIENTLANFKDGKTVLVSVLRTHPHPETCHAMTREPEFTTIGTNDFDNDSLDRWQLVGWDWETGDFRQFEIYGDKNEHYEVLTATLLPE